MKRPSLLITRLKKALQKQGLTARPQCSKCHREVDLQDLGRGGLCGVCARPSRIVHYI